MREVYIKEIGKTVPFDHLEELELTDHMFNSFGVCRRLVGVPALVNDEILQTGSGIVTCILGEDVAHFYTAPGFLIEVNPRQAVGNGL